MGFLKLARLGCQLGVVGSLLFTPYSFPAQSRSYDGDWWQQRTSPELEGFIFGYGDCYADPAGQKIRMSLDDADIRIAVGIFYQGHQKLRTRPVADVLKDIWAGHIPVYEAKRAAPGEGWRARHGYFDGLWWKGSSSAEQLGFVEGYVACHNREQRKAKPLQLEPPRYVELLSAWYAPSDESVAAQHQAEKIADVLLRFGERTAAASR
jgi:hypothetical protein